MPTISKSFDLDRPIDLPKDTVFHLPALGKRCDEVAARQSPREEISGLPLFDDGCRRRACTQCMSRMVCGKLFVASNAKASYLVVEEGDRRVLEILLRGGTPRQALNSLKRAHPATAEQRLRSLLAQFALRNFFEDADTAPFVPEGNILQFYVTNACNLSCRHCYVDAGSALPSGEMTTAERFRALEAFAEVYPGGKVTFTGGESLVSRDIFRLLAKAKALGLRIELYSNGTLIQDRRLAWRLVCCVDILQLSLDGATAEVNDAIRGRGTFERIVRAIRLLDELAVDSKAFAYRIALTLTAGNYEDIRSNLGSLLARLNLNGRHSVSIGGAMHLGRAAGNPSVFTSTEHMEAIQSYVVHELMRQGVYAFPFSQVNRLRYCCGLGGVVGLSADGKFYPCSITNQLPVGSIQDGSLKKIIRRIRAYSDATSIDNVVGCRECDIRYICGGACRITNLTRTGSYTACVCSPECKRAKIRSLMRRYDSFLLSAELQNNSAPFNQEIVPWQPNERRKQLRRAARRPAARDRRGSSWQFT
jgi:radical SAM protein with 4Fe4S-binding SPASM domain